MKIKLTPELAYIIGLWRHRKIDKGIGIKGNDRLLSVFTKTVIDTGLTEPNKLLTEKDTVFFYHSAYRKFFQDIESELIERFRYKNEFSKAYLAGLFDSKGGFAKGKEKTGNRYPYISNADIKDEMIILRLGFRCRFAGKKNILIIQDKRRFIDYIREWLKIIEPV